MKAKSAVTINRPLDEVSSRWPEAESAADRPRRPKSPTLRRRVTGAPRSRGDIETAGGGLGEQGRGSVWASDPQRRLDDALRRFKQILETGEVVRSDGSPEGTDATAQRNQQPAQPADADPVGPKEIPMRANCWMGRNTVEVRDVPDPTILNARDAIVQVTSTAICGSDLHLYDGYIPTMEKGDILGHEFMGRGRRARARRDATWRSATAWSFRSRSRAEPATRARRASTPPARTPTRTPGWPRSCGATRRPACSATPT